MLHRQTTAVVINVIPKLQWKRPGQYIFHAVAEGSLEVLYGELTLPSPCAWR